MSDSPNAYCPVCGNGMDLSEKELNALNPACCCEECEQEWKDENGTRDFEQEWKEHMAELNYRCGYEYAAGYHD